MQRLVIYLAVLFFNTGLLAQQDGKQYHSLLWRITGNGLSKPSYLYGTMHLTDKQLFYFGDSLYKALEQSDGFAAELDMSTVANEYINFMVSEREEKSAAISEVLNEKKLEQYTIKLEKKFGKPISKVTVKDIEKEERNQTNKMLAKGEMKTFMDAYLFDIASKQGKWTGGIEDFEDQVGLDKGETLEEKLDNLFAPQERTDKTIDWMINVYLKQDLDLIDRRDEIWRGSKDIILLKRNAKMSRRMDSLAHVRSCLFAIGAAHIPGDSGVVSLLRKRGFTVTPVTSSQKIAPEKYTYKIVERPWINVETKDSLYTLQMPGKAEIFKMFENMPFDMKMYFDMGSMILYMTIGIQVPPVNENKKDSLLTLMAQRYKKKNLDFQEKNILVGTEKGKEFILHNEYGEFRLQAFVPGNFMAINGVFALKKETMAAADADRFFQSFRSNNKPVTPIVPGKDKWQKYTFSNYTFSVELPGKYREKKKDKTDEAWDEKNYEMIDIAGNAYYGILIEESKPGYYSNEDSAYFNRVQESLETNMEARKISSRKFDINGFPASESVMEAGKGDDNIGLKILLVNRGNRRFMLLSTYEPKNSAAVDRFFSSFTFLPLSRINWQQETAPDKSFYIWSPSPVKTQVDSSDHTLHYSLFDSAAAVSVNINKNVLSPYYWAANDSLMYDQRIKTFMGYSDSLINYKKVQNGNVKGVDLLIRLGGTHNLKKMRLLLNADTVYTIFGYMPMESLETNEYKKLFESFRIAAEAPPVKFSERKPAALLAALRSGDSVVFAQAKLAFETVTFEKQDVPLLQQALLYQYRDFDSGYYSNTNSAITNEVIKLDSDHTSISFIKDNYTAITAKHERIKPFLLSILSSIKTRASYDLLKEIILQRPPILDSPYYFRHNLYDSLTLTRHLYPEVFSKAADPGLSWLILGPGASLIDSNLLTRNDLLPYKGVFVAIAKKGLAKNKDELEQNARDYYDLVKLLGALNLPEANAQLNRFGKLSNRGIRMNVTVALLKNNQLVDRKDIYTLATTDEYRSGLYDELKKMGKLSLFPADYLSQKFLGQSVLYGYATDDDESPQFISCIGERTALFMGKKQKFYLYKVPFDEIDSTRTYLGIAGPYSLNPKDLSSTHDATRVVWDEKFDLKKIDAMFKKYLAETEEPLKADKKDKEIPFIK